MAHIAYDIVAQNFTNTIKKNDSFAIRCIEQYINIDILKDVPRIANWKAHIFNLALPYEKGNIEGGIFVYAWISYIWNIEICIWPTKTMTILATFHPKRKTTKVFNVIQYQIGINQFHLSHCDK